MPANNILNDTFEGDGHMPDNPLYEMIFDNEFDISQ